MKDYGKQRLFGKVVAVIGFFKGYYFKCSTKEETIALIPAIHGTGRKKEASLQIITENEVINIPVQNMVFHKKSVKVKAGKSLFSLKGIRLDINTDEVKAEGVIRFSDIRKIKYDIMGPFRFLPLMQCRHSIFSMDHQVNGKIEINGKKYLFSDGHGYIEGDKGCSFPREYAWTQCHHEDISLTLAVADIPLAGLHFTGVIGIIHSSGQEYRLATYLGAKASYIGNQTIIIQQGRYRFMAHLLEKKGQSLYAPQKGKMERTIQESARCTARYRFEENDRKIFDFSSEMASFEYEYDQ